MLLAGLAACDQQFEARDLGSDLPEEVLVNDLLLKELGDLGPAPLQVEPARPMSGESLLLALDVPGATTAQIQVQGRGCGTLTSHEGVPPLFLDGRAGDEGSCSLHADVILQDGTVQTFSTGFGVKATDPVLLPVEVNHSVFFAAELPHSSDSGPEVLAIEGSVSFVNGSTADWQVFHDPTQRVTAALVSVEGFGGYYRIPVEDAGDGVVALSLQFPRDAFERMGGARDPGLELAVSLVGADGSVGAPASAPIEGTVVGNGDVKVSVSWNGGADVDLHVTEPSGETVFYGNRESQTGGRLDLDSNPTCDLDGTNAENIFWPSEEAPGGS